MEDQGERDPMASGERGKKRGSDYSLLLVATSIIVVIAVVLAIVLLVPSSPAETETRFAFQEGEHLTYAITGTYLNRTFTGAYNVSLANVVNGRAMVSYPSLYISDQELSAMDLGLGLSADSLSGHDVGAGRFATPFGMKEVKWNFAARPGGLFKIDYYGLDPFIVYGGVINGKDLHLDFVLSETSNPYIKANNTNPIVEHRAIFPEERSGTSQATVLINSSIASFFYHPNGGVISFDMSVAAYDMDVYAFSEGNLRSMAEGGPLAFDLDGTRLGVSDLSETLPMPPGPYVIVFLFHTPAQNYTTEATYEWAVTWND